MTTQRDDSLDHDPAAEREREHMVRMQIAARGVKDPRTLEAMRRAPRHMFVPEARQAEAHADHPLPIGEGQTISQPYIVALMTELAEIEPEDRVLEVGTGCGYQTLVLSLLAREVCTLEIRPKLQQEARRRLEELGRTNVRYRVGSGFDGWPGDETFDAIIVTAAPSFVPDRLTDQLGDGGRLVIPVGGDFGQDLLQIRRLNGRLARKTVLPVRFVTMEQA